MECGGTRLPGIIPAVLKYLKRYALRQTPQGAAEGGARGIASNYENMWEADPLFQYVLKTWQSMS